MDGVTSEQLEGAYKDGYTRGAQKSFDWFKEELRSTNQPERLFMEKYADDIRIPSEYQSSSNEKVCFQYGVFDCVMGYSERTSERVNQLSGARR